MTKGSFSNTIFNNIGTMAKLYGSFEWNREMEVSEMALLKREEKRTKPAGAPPEYENRSDAEAINEIAQELEQAEEEAVIDDAAHIDEYTVPDAQDWEPESAGGKDMEQEEIFAVLERDTDEFQAEEE